MRRVRAAGPMAALVVFVITMVGMAVTGATLWAMLLAIAVLTLLPSEERD